MGHSPHHQKLLRIRKCAILTVLMNVRKTPGEKSQPAGIALPRDLIEAGRTYAKQHGHGGLSGLTRHLLTTYLAKAAEAAQEVSQEAKAKGQKKVASGTKKVCSRR
jgi:hypothetical protein